jgi:diguanylate cyclase (GGDEF)-like protein
VLSSRRPRAPRTPLSTRIRLLATAIALAAAAPLAAQRTPEPRALLAEAERIEGVNDDSALKLVRRALPGLAAPAARPLRARALALECATSAGSAEPAELVVRAERGMGEARAAGDARAFAYLRLCRGAGLDASGEGDAAGPDFEFALTEARRLNDPALLAGVMAARGSHRYYRGDLGGALEDLSQAYAIYQRLGKDRRVRGTLNDIASVYADRRVAEYDRAIEYYRQLLAADEQAHDAAGQADRLFNLGSTLEQKGAAAAALGWYRRALDVERRRRAADQVAYCERAIGIVLGKLGREREALAWIDRALAFHQGYGDAFELAWTRLSRGVVLNRLRRPADALREFDAAGAYFQSAHVDRFMEKVHEERATALAALGDYGGAYGARTAQLALGRTLQDRLREEITSQLRVRFDTEKKDAENRALVRENALRGRALRDAARIRSLQTVVIALTTLIIAFLGYAVVRHVRNERRLRILAMTDELTRLPNRRHLLQVAGERVQEARKGTGPLSVLALDIDHFKRINDTFGHDVGDRVLHRVADACRAALRRDDVIGRTGGEEFVVVMPGADARVAVEVAERLRAAVERVEWGDVAPGLRATVSVGAAEWTPGDGNFAALARRADDSLYRAKELGRNRTELAQVG